MAATPSTTQPLHVLYYDTLQWWRLQSRHQLIQFRQETDQDRAVLWYIYVRTLDHNSVVLTRCVDIDHTSHGRRPNIT